jgi:hypothetical protein
MKAERVEEGKLYPGSRKVKGVLPCKNCGIKPVMEIWASGGMWYAIRCNNTYRPDDCDNGFYRSKCQNPEEAIRRWNEWCREDSE